MINEQKELVVFCTKCGIKNNEGSKFCSQCGGRLDEISPPLENKTTSVKSEKMSIGNIIFIVIVVLLVAKCATNKDNSSTNTSQKESNPNHVSSDISVTQNQAETIVKLIQAYGYTCNTLSSAFQSSYDGSYTVTCNNWRYSYEIEDVGGNWVVTVD